MLVFLVSLYLLTQDWTAATTGRGLLNYHRDGRNSLGDLQLNSKINNVSKSSEKLKAETSLDSYMIRRRVSPTCCFVLDGRNQTELKYCCVHANSARLAARSRKWKSPSVFEYRIGIIIRNVVTVKGRSTRSFQTVNRLYVRLLTS